MKPTALLLLLLLFACAAGRKVTVKEPDPTKATLAAAEPKVTTAPMSPMKITTAAPATSQLTAAPTPKPTTAATPKPPAMLVTKSTAEPRAQPDAKGVPRSAPAQLDIFPGLQVKEGDRVTVRCSGIYPDGANPASFLQLQLNGTLARRGVRWLLAKNELRWSNWTDGKADRIDQLGAVFVLRLQITARANDNGMKIQCSSDDASSATGSVVMQMSVQNAPKVLDCFSNPAKLVKGRAVKVTCTVLEGNPPGAKPSLQTTSTLSIPQSIKETFSAWSAFGQRIFRYEWRLRPVDFSQALRIKVSAENEVGSNSASFSVQPSGGVKKLNPPGKLVLFPDAEVNLHVGDVVSCNLSNGSSVPLSLVMVGKFKDEVLASMTSDAISYRLEAKHENKLINFYCKAGDLRSETREKTIYAKNHRVFLDIQPGLEVQTSQKLTALCYFLPAKDPVQELTLSMTTPRNKVVLNYNGTATGSVISNDFGSRATELKCDNTNDLWSCRLVINTLQPQDFGATLSCLMKNGFRTDSIQRRLTVKVPPYAVIISPRQIDLTSAGAVEAKCLVQMGSPEANLVTFEFEGDTSKRVQSKRFATMKDRNGLSWQLMTLNQNLTISNAGRNLSCRAVSTFKESLATRLVTIKTPLRFLFMTPSNGSIVASGSEVRCAVEGFPKPSLTMQIGYSDRQRVIYFARVLGSKTTVTGEEIRYNLALRSAPNNADVLVVCRATQGSDTKELRHVFKRSPEDTF